MEIKNDNENLFRRYLDGELNEEEEIRALHMIADDKNMREMLQFERTLLQTYSNVQNPDSFSVPSNFTNSVMEKISTEKVIKDSSQSSKTKRVFKLFEPKHVVVRPVYAAAAILLLSIGFGYFLNNSVQTTTNLQTNGFENSTQVVSETESEIWIRFVYFAEDAERIEVAGDFNEWDPIPLNREFIGDQQVWTGLVPVTRGEHRYMFLKNGEEWLTDPLADIKRDDGFGNENAVLYL